MDAAFDGKKMTARDNSSPAFIWNPKLLLAASPAPLACRHVNNPLTSSSSQPIENESILFPLRPHPLRPAPPPHLHKPLGPSPAPRPCHHPLRASSFQTLPALAPPPAPRLKSWKRPTRTSFRACKIASGHCQLFPFALVEPGQQNRNDSVSIISVRTLNRICPFLSLGTLGKHPAGRRWLKWCGHRIRRRGRERTGPSTKMDASATS